MMAVLYSEGVGGVMLNIVIYLLPFTVKKSSGCSVKVVISPWVISQYVIHWINNLDIHVLGFELCSCFGNNHV